MRKKILKTKDKQSKIIAIFVSLLFIMGYSCHEELWDNPTWMKYEAEAIEKAKAWYDANRPETVGLFSAGETDQMPMKPEWTYVFATQNENFEVVETDLMSQGKLLFVDESCMEMYEKTNDSKYHQCYTRIVFRTDRKTNETVGFLMTVVPNLEWLEKSRFKPFKEVTYLYRSKEFGGKILFHEMDGRYSNGWVYENGKIVAAVSALDANPNDSFLRSMVCWFEPVYKYVLVCMEWYTVREDGPDYLSGSTCYVEQSFSHLAQVCYDDGNNSGGGYVPPPTDYGNGSGNGSSNGGSGNGSSGGNYPVVTYTKSEYSQIAAAINQLIPQIYNLLLAKGINISNYQFRVADFCTANARYLDGFIELCTSFLNWGIYDQASIIWHEIYHLLYDLPWSTSLHPLYQTIILNPPSWAENYIRTVILDPFSSLSIEAQYYDYIRINTIRDPQYYQNEINAYQAERNAMPDSSSGYQAAGDYMLWWLQQLLEIANTYY